MPKTETHETETHECNYDKNPTSLYQALEEKAWLPVLSFIETGSWETGRFFCGSVQDPLSPERQVKTWVTRFNSDGTVRWSQLPLHAAIIFGAPYKVIRELVCLFSQGVRSTDDQHMLPLHLAIKFGAEDSVITCLLQEFPEALFTKDIKGRLPTEVEGPRDDRSQVMEQVIAVMTRTLTKRHGVVMKDNMTELKDDLVLRTNLYAELEREKKELEQKYKRVQEELRNARLELHSRFRLPRGRGRGARSKSATKDTDLLGKRDDSGSVNSDRATRNQTVQRSARKFEHEVSSERAAMNHRTSSRKLFNGRVVKE